MGHWSSRRFVSVTFRTMVLRFPNPGADIERMLRIYGLVVKESESKGIDVFDLDFMVQVAASNYQASSGGAIGASAIAKSARVNRSLDALYNQMKMYSEIYRNLGLLRSVDQRLKFRTTLLGQTQVLGFEGDPIANGIIRESLLAMTFPNESSRNIGVINARPFRWLLLLMNALDGVITRHEMIIGLLNIEDDLDPNVFQAKVDLITKLRRKTRADLMKEVERVAIQSQIQINTLENYTRFPVGVLNSSTTNWATSKYLSGIYDRKMVGLELGEYGIAVATEIKSRIDLRRSNLEFMNQDERVNFARFAYYSLLYRAGLDSVDLENEIKSASERSREILTTLGITSPRSFVYSPHLEESDAVITLAESEE